MLPLNTKGEILFNIFSNFLNREADWMRERLRLPRIYCLCPFLYRARVKIAPVCRQIDQFEVSLVVNFSRKSRNSSEPFFYVRNEQLS